MANAVTVTVQKQVDGPNLVMQVVAPKESISVVMTHTEVNNLIDSLCGMRDKIFTPPQSKTVHIAQK